MCIRDRHKQAKADSSDRTLIDFSDRAVQGQERLLPIISSTNFLAFMIMQVSILFVELTGIKISLIFVDLIHKNFISLTQCYPCFAFFSRPVDVMRILVFIAASFFLVCIEKK